ncbi:hypothetical protein TSOC_001146 [Tetrabaena socialis]|uniref:Uncharacterized protein n=1 Tax=Tetrabaena socialis TaxID=47790 RepID=A0A2J8AHG5_9CHLO|nr:hypothetical protein TSOC_001146 [Tetrabaena socialis]|eukprot:PNH11964.1 hypothetical protein TSOC_001146 [Tetrabaena socialis]
MARVHDNEDGMDVEGAAAEGSGAGAASPTDADAMAAAANRNGAARRQLPLAAASGATKQRGGGLLPPPSPHSSGGGGGSGGGSGAGPTRDASVVGGSTLEPEADDSLGPMPDWRMTGAEHATQLNVYQLAEVVRAQEEWKAAKRAQEARRNSAAAAAGKHGNGGGRPPTPRGGGNGLLNGSSRDGGAGRGRGYPGQPPSPAGRGGGGGGAAAAVAGLLRQPFVLAHYMGQRVQVPVRNLTVLAAHYDVVLSMRNFPGFLAYQGVTAQILQCAGYTVGTGPGQVAVVEELLGEVLGPAGPSAGSPRTAEAPHPAAAHQTTGLQRLWTTLRLCFIHGVWCVHKDLDPARHHSHAVVAHVVAALRCLLWPQFRMTALSDDLLDPLPTAILNAQLKATKLADFKAAWAHRRVLCEVVEPAAGGAQLRVLVSLSGPVVAPAAPAAAGEEG